jgi:chlorobactene glucosyltransferase
MNPVLLAIPWFVCALLVPLLFRQRLRVRDFPSTIAQPPLVSVIVPARNEAANIAPCIGTLLNSDYRQREVIVVNDGSTDETGTIAQALAERANGELTVINTPPLPSGWLGKNWACWTGYQRAKGELLLFTDADTRHDDELLGHAVGAWSMTHAGIVTVLPRQLMLSFWERVVLPQVFLPIHLRFFSLRRTHQPRTPRLAIANGQFILISRAVYEAIGGHQAVRGEVVEDMRLAQRTVAEGHRVLIVDAQDEMETRMYASLRGITEGWTKNLDRGARLSFPRGLGRIALLLGALIQIVLWVIPPVILILGLFMPALAGLRAWSIIATSLGVFIWLTVHLLMRTSLIHALFFPLGAFVSACILVLSSVRGDRVKWRGRAYQLTEI